ncbi:hypothetical protein MW733_006761 [Pseudomonas aeruginosa]|nr:hypothetical protein [Pseudomonas aeruginosa]
MRRTVGLPAEDSQPSTPDLFNEAMYDLKLNGFGTTLALDPPAWAIISRSSSPDISKAYQWSRFTEAGIDAVGFGSSVERVVREALELGAVDIAPRDVLESLSRRPSFDAQGFSVDSIMRMRLGEAPYQLALGGLVVDPRLAAQEHSQAPVERELATELLEVVLEQLPAAGRAEALRLLIADQDIERERVSAEITAQVWELFEQNEAATYQLYLLDCALMNAHPARFSDWRGFMLERSPAEPEVEYSPVPGV